MTAIPPRRIAEIVTDIRVRKDQEVEDQSATVTELTRQLRNAEAVLVELRSDRDDAVAAEQAAWLAVPSAAR